MATRSNLSVLGLYSYDNTIFDNMVLPDGVDRETLVNNIITELAELELLYPSAPFMATMLSIWSYKELPTWERAYKAVTEEYNPLHNYDRYEEWTDTGTDTETGTGSTTNSGTSSSTSTDTGDTEQVNQISAYNASDFQNQSKSTATRDLAGTATTETSGTSSSSAETSRDTSGEHSGHLYGNIGVTTSQQMLTAELDIAGRANIYDYITKDFKNRFCLLVY